MSSGPMRQAERRLLVRLQPVLGAALAAMGLFSLGLQASAEDIQLRGLGTGFILFAGGLSLIHRSKRGWGLLAYLLAAAALAGAALWLSR